MDLQQMQSRWNAFCRMTSEYRKLNMPLLSMEQRDALITECSHLSTQINVEKLRQAGIKQSSPVMIENASDAVVDSMLKIASLVTGKKLEYQDGSGQITSPDSGQSAQSRVKTRTAADAPPAQAKPYTWLLVLALAFAAFRSK